MKVLVTGAKGFIGEWVLRALWATEHTTIAFSGDVRDKSTFPQASVAVIIHLAALVTHLQQHNVKDLYEVNVLGTKNLVEAYSEAKMVYISTTDVTRKKLSEYAKTKLEAERLVEERGNYAIIRLPSVFGPKQRQVKLITLLFNKYCQNGKCTINNNDLREYIYVGDAAREIVTGIEKKGLITLGGFKVKNFDLDKMIRAVCKRENIANLMPAEHYFFTCLQKCLSTYLRTTT